MEPVTGFPYLLFQFVVNRLAVVEYSNTMVMGKGVAKKGAKKSAKKGTKGGKQSKKSSTKAPRQKEIGGSYEFDDDDRETENHLKRFDIDGTYEYEMPDRFEDDEELDEDEAFNSDDEKRYAGMFDSKSGAAEDEPEDNGDEEYDGEDGGGMLLSDMLNDNNTAETTAPKKKVKSKKKSKVVDSGLGAMDFSDSEGDDEQQQGKLMSFVDELGGGKRGRARGVTGGRSEQTEVGDESEFSKPAMARGTVTMDDLIGSLQNDSTHKLGSLKKQLDGLAKGKGPASAPVAAVVENRATRRVLYDDVSTDMGKWTQSVKSNREAETLNLASQEGPKEGLSNASLTEKFTPTASSALESAVAGVLGAAGGGDEAALRAEEANELAANEFTPEQLRQRQAELSKLRALVFYQEQKHKRVKKIKSKAYHKIRNKKRARDELKARDRLRETDPEAAAALDLEDEEKRARERMSLKHKNSGSWAKGVLARGHGASADQRAAVQEQLRRSDQLRRVMNGGGGGESESEEGDEEDAAERLKKKAKGLVLDIENDRADEETEEGAGAAAGGLFNLKFMQRALVKQREAAAEEANALLAELQGEDVNSEGSAFDDSDDEERDQPPSDPSDGKSGSKSSSSSSGLTSAQKKAAADAKQAMTAALGSDGLQLGAVRMPGGARARAQQPISVDLGQGEGEEDEGEEEDEEEDEEDEEEEDEDEEGANPWVSGVKAGAGSLRGLHGGKRRAAAAQQALDVTLHMGGGELSLPGSENTSTKAVKAKAKAEAAKKAEAEAKAKARKTGAANGTEKSGADSKENKGKEAKVLGPEKPSQQALLAALDDEDDDEDDDEEEDSDDDGLAGLSQEALVRRAFASAGDANGEDAVDEDFEREKERAMELDANATASKRKPKFKEMAGWGSWVGDGVVAKPPPAGRGAKRKGGELEGKAGAKVSKKGGEKTASGATRKDAKLPHVIINEKKNKKAAKYMATRVPYPFTSREQYERSLRNPLGGDWNTSVVAHSLTRPQVISRAGQIIQPLSLTAKAKRVAAEARASGTRKAKL